VRGVRGERMAIRPGRAPGRRDRPAGDPEAGLAGDSAGGAICRPATTAPWRRGGEGGWAHEVGFRCVHLRGSAFIFARRAGSVWGHLTAGLAVPGPGEWVPRPGV